MPWTTLAATTQILAVHAALTETGQILLVGGDQHDRDLNDANDVFHTRLFDCASLTISAAPSPPFDAFCAGHAHLVDGRVLFAGGTQDYPGTHTHEAHGFFGLRDAAIWNPRSRTWKTAALMSPQPGTTTGGGRWYPTLVTLADGTALAVTGLPVMGDGRDFNDSPEAYSPSPREAGTWRLLSGADPAHRSSLYPRCFVLPGGDVFFANPVGGRTQRLRPAPYGWTDLAGPVPDGAYHGFNASAVLLPLLPEEGYRAKVLVTGGVNTYLFDTGSPSLGWQPRGRGLTTPQPRVNSQAVLLANGTVAVVGGAADAGNDATAVRAVELYDPATGSWSVGDTAAVVRNYHSVALLMPDGRVFTAGGNRNAGESFPSAGVDTRELRIELYAPPYFAAARPAIGWAPRTVGWGDGFWVQTTQADRIRRVAMIRAGTSTHAWDGDQRFVGCVFRREGDWLFVEAPPDSTIAPPGTYQLVTINDAKVPSPGRFVRLAPPPRGSSGIVQTNVGSRGDYVAVSPRQGGGLNAHTRANDAAGVPWSAPVAVGASGGVVASAPSILQGNFGGNLEVVARIGDRLAFYWRGASTWHGPFLFGAPGVTGNPAMIQSLFGGRGNFELVVPLASGGFAHYWRDNDAPGLPWRGPFAIGQSAGPIAAVALLQSTFGDPGNLEVVARYGNRLALWWRQSGPPWNWSGPHFFFTGATGVPSMIQSRTGTVGTFELVTPLETSGAGHMSRNNDAAGLPWSGVVATIAAGEQVVSASLMESNYGSPGHGGNYGLVLGMANGRHAYYARDDATFAWSGPVPLP